MRPSHWKQSVALTLALGWAVSLSPAAHGEATGTHTPQGELQGIFYASQQADAAIIVAKGSTSSRYRVGDTVPGIGNIIEIGETFVIIERSGTHYSWDTQRPILVEIRQ